MPSSATITAFYNFTAATRAKSSEVNTNFGNFRGHIIPIDPNTSTAAASNTYDVGAATHRWRTSYVASVDFLQATTTVATTIEGDASLTTGGLKVKVAGTEVMRFTPLGFAGLNFTTMEMTTTAARGQVALSPELGAAMTGLNTLILTSTVVPAGSTLTLETIGRPVFVGFIHGGDPGNDSYFYATMTALTLASYPASNVIKVFAFMDTVTSDIMRMAKTGVWPTSTMSLVNAMTNHAPNYYTIVRPSAGVHTFWPQFTRSASDGAFTRAAELGNVKFIAFEL